MARAFRIFAQNCPYRGRGAPAKRLLVRVLFDSCDHKGTVELVTVATLANPTGIGERQTQRNLHELAVSGDLEIEPQYRKPRRDASEHGRQLPNLYRLITPWVTRQLEGEALAQLAPAAAAGPAIAATNAPMEKPPPPKPPPKLPPLLSRLTHAGGCQHCAVACEACLAHG